MKKSELLHIAQDAVLNSGYGNRVKLEVLRVLIAEENLALFSEENEKED